MVIVSGKKRIDASAQAPDLRMGPIKLGLPLRAPRESDIGCKAPLRLLGQLEEAISAPLKHEGLVRQVAVELAQPALEARLLRLAHARLIGVHPFFDRVRNDPRVEIETALSVEVTWT